MPDEKPKVVYSLQEPKNEFSREQLQGENFTDQFRKNYRILKFSEYESDGGKKESYTLSIKFDGSFDDNNIIYSMTKYMTDAELELLNKDRVSQKLKPLPRLAYTGSLTFKKVASQRERAELERLVAHPVAIDVPSVMPELVNLRGAKYDDPF